MSAKYSVGQRVTVVKGSLCGFSGTITKFRANIQGLGSKEYLVEPESKDIKLSWHPEGDINNFPESEECEHGDVDHHNQCLDCEKDLTEDRMVAAYDRWKASRYDGDY